jgi:hypothetical protein
MRVCQNGECGALRCFTSPLSIINLAIPPRVQGASVAYGDAAYGRPLDPLALRLKVTLGNSP